MSDFKQQQHLYEAAGNTPEELFSYATNQPLHIRKHSSRFPLEHLFPNSFVD